MSVAAAMTSHAPKGGVPGAKGEVLTYEPVKAWLTGAGAIWLQV